VPYAEELFETLRVRALLPKAELAHDVATLQALGERMCGGGGGGERRESVEGSTMRTGRGALALQLLLLLLLLPSGVGVCVR
jgi:hypothetical protein